MDDIDIRIACADDAEALLAIYAPYVLNTAVSFEYDVPSASEFKSRIEKTLEFYPYILAYDGAELLGYAYTSRFHARAAYDWNAEASIYVKQGCAKKRRGARTLRGA